MEEGKGDEGEKKKTKALRDFELYTIKLAGI
jgi:hypothetical protein